MVHEAMAKTGDSPAPDDVAKERAKSTAAFINERWTGVTEGDIRACAEKARQNDPFTGSPGVVVVAIGANKARFVTPTESRSLVPARPPQPQLRNRQSPASNRIGGRAQLDFNVVSEPVQALHQLALRQVGEIAAHRAGYLGLRNPHPPARFLLAQPHRPQGAQSFLKP